jgi:D-threo-aldose 1-dehydrogenase
MINLTSSRPLGSTDLTLGRLGLGVAPLGNLYTEVSEAQAQDTLSAAERAGIGWFDVAPYYGFGLAEARLGSFLQRSRNTPRVISTKVGRLLQPRAVAPEHEQFVAPAANQPVFDYTSSGIERAYADSLRRLGVDRVQILLLHDVDRLNHRQGHRRLVEELLQEALPTLRRLKAAGAIDAFGLGINEWDIGYEILASANVDCILLAGRYTLLDSTALTSGFLDACARRGVAVLAGGVFNSGFLAGGTHYDYRLADQSKQAARESLLEICRRHEVELPAVALQFTAAHPAVTSVVVGARSAQEVESLVHWSRTDIPAQVWSELRDAQLIPDEAPTELT